MSACRARKHTFIRLASCLLVLASLIGVALAVTPSRAAAVGPQTWWVDDGSNDASSGTEAEPFKTITHALSVAAQGDTVMIKPGTYNAANGETFPLAPWGVSLKSTDGTATTIIDAGGAECMVLQGSLTGVELRGLTMRNGSGGLTVYSGYGTTATDSPLIADNYFTDNADSSAVYIYSSATGVLRPRIENNVFVDNTGMQGAGLQVSGYTSATIVSNVFDSNETTEGNGGGLCLLTTHGQNALVQDNVFVGNRAIGGAAITCAGGLNSVVTISNNSFIENEAEYRGGAMQLSGASARYVVSGNDAAGNDAEHSGGFVYQYDGETTSTNNAIGGNGSPGDGAAWYIAAGRFREYNDTVVDSQDGTSSIYATAGADAAIANCIVWNPNMSTDIFGVDSVSYSCVRDTAVASKVGAVGPSLIFTDPVWADPGAHAPDIGAGSPCIDAANGALAPATDFYGVARPVDGDGNGVAKADIGCCERTGEPTALTLAAPATCAYKRARVSGSLEDSAGAAMPDRRVILEYSYNNWSTVAGSMLVTTTASGTYAYTFAPTRKTYYRARFMGDATRLGSSPAARVVLPKVYLTTPSARSTMRVGRTYKVSGYLKPRHTSGTKPIRILLYRYRSGRWVLQSKHYHAKVSDYSSYSKYSVSIRLTSRGRWRLKAYHLADSLNAATKSGYRYVSVR